MCSQTYRCSNNDPVEPCRSGGQWGPESNFLNKIFNSVINIIETGEGNVKDTVSSDMYIGWIWPSQIYMELTCFPKSLLLHQQAQ